MSMTTDDLAPELEALGIDDDDDAASAAEVLDGSENETFDSAAEAERFLASFPGSPERAAVAASWTDKQREQMAARGINPGGPIDESSFQRRPNWNESRGRSELAAGLAAIRAGRVDVVPDVYARIEELAAIADRLPEGGKGGEAVERATFLIARARAQAFESEPFWPTSTTHRTRANGDHETVERDSLGRERVTVRPKETVEAAIAERQEAESFGDVAKITPETVMGWPMDKRLRFIDENPGRWGELMTIAERAMDDADRRRR